MSRRRIQPKIGRGSPQAVALLHEVPPPPPTDWEAVARTAIQQRDDALATLNQFANLTRTHEMLVRQIRHAENVTLRVQLLLPLLEKVAEMLEQVKEQQ